MTDERLLSIVTGRVKAISTAATHGSQAAAPAMEQLYLYDEAGRLTQRTDEVLGLTDTYAHDVPAERGRAKFC